MTQNVTPELSVDDFAAFFKEVHSDEPFPWQKRLVRVIAQEGKWPDVLDLPTGSGKTAALDAAVFHLALEAQRGCERRAPVRIALVVDRRLVVDDAFARAKRISRTLASAENGSVTGRVAACLRSLAGEGNPPLLAQRLRGGVPRESDWARTPSQPTILCSTVDQVGSRLLFRGYGVSDSMKPVHAGLMGTDCLILLDEAHLSEPFRQTLGWVRHYKSGSWRESKDKAAPWGFSLLTATPGMESGSPFRLETDDYEDPTLKRRWTAAKPARLFDLSRAKGPGEGGAENGDEETARAAEKRRASAIVSKVKEGLQFLKETGLDQPAFAVVVNRVARARDIFEDLRKSLGGDGVDTTLVDTTLMIGPSRSVDRDCLAEETFAPIRTGNKDRKLERPLVIVATQCIEVGVDIDLDGLVTEAAPIDALRQRFGRLNRDGRKIAPYAAIVGGKSDVKDPVYGEAAGKTWKYLIDAPSEPASKGAPEAKVDFGLAEFQPRLGERAPDNLQELLSPRKDAPVLLPAHLDLLSQTAPIPSADPEVSLYLHGPDRASDTVTIIWRSDIGPGPEEDRDARTRRLLLLVPPRSAEAIELPLWAVQAWLRKTNLSALTDIPSPAPEDDRSRPSDEEALVFHWAGDDERSTWIGPAQIRPGQTIVVPAEHGGVDRYGWNPNPKPRKAASDVADKAAAPFAGRRFAVRVAPQMLATPDARDRLAETIAVANTGRWRDLRDAVRDLVAAEAASPSSAAENREDAADPEAEAKRLSEIKAALGKLDGSKGRVQVYTDLYVDQDGSPRGVVFLAPFGIEDRLREAAEESESPSTTEDDIAGSLTGFDQPLQKHTAEVEGMVERFARWKPAGLSESQISDLRLAAYLHDAGKADPRFQSWLAYGDPLGSDPDCPGKVLAKSARRLPRGARTSSGLPEHWRHEALSVRLAPHIPRFSEAKDPELVLWLVGTHHGQGRPLFPHADPQDEKQRSGLPSVLEIPGTLAPGPGPQSLAYDWDGSDWPGLYERLKIRYGVWELARLEAILRLADHRASEEAAKRPRAKDVSR